MNKDSQKPIKIAVIEDDTPIRQMYTFKLEHEGFKVEGANDGKEGLELSERFRPDLILLDLMTPQMNGDKMLEAMRAEEWGKDVLVIVLTNVSADEAPMNLRLLKVEKYIVKAHHTPKQVLDIVNETLKRHGKI